MIKERFISEEVSKMPSSIKMFKASETFGGDNTAKIDTKFEIEEVLKNEGSETETEQAISEIEIAQRKRQALLTQTKSEVHELKQKAEKEIEDLRKKAREEGYSEGQKAGFKDGKKQGFIEGQLQAENQNKEMKASILLMIQEAKEEIKAYQEDKREEFIMLASHMAEKIVHDQIDRAEEGVLMLA